MERANPLRAIKDKNHWENILNASDRHKNTNYEALLDEGRNKRAYWEIEDVKEFARWKFN